MLTFLFLHISEQGRRNDLKNKKNDVNGLISVSASNSSDSVHCNLSTQFTVSSGWSCHTTVSCTDKDDDKDSSPHLCSAVCYVNLINIMTVHVEIFRR